MLRKQVHNGKHSKQPIQIPKLQHRHQNHCSGKLSHWSLQVFAVNGEDHYQIEN